MSSPAADSHLREVLVRLLPWLAKIGIGPTTKNLEVKSANGKIDFAEGPLAPVARAGDFSFRFWPVVTSGNITAIYVSTDVAAPVTWRLAVAHASPPTSNDLGTVVTVGAGSPNVRSA